MNDTKVVTIEDVALAAGVSKTLVSRYLNDKPGVGVANKERIAAAIKQLGYRRNEIARSLVQQKTGAIGVILDTLCAVYFFDLIDGLGAGGIETGYDIIFCDCRKDADVKRKYLDYFSHGRADGLIIYGSRFSDNQIFTDFSNVSFPFVFIENDIPNINADKVLLDNRGAFSQLVNRLYGKGYRDIRLVGWKFNTFAFQERLEGFMAGMKECGLNIDDSVICHVNSVEETKAVAGDWIDKKTLPEAIVFSNDQLAFAAMEVFLDKGVNVPGDVAVASFDNGLYLKRDRIMPAITTMEQPLFEMGKSAIHILAERISNPDCAKKKLIYAAKLIEGVTD